VRDYILFYFILFYFGFWRRCSIIEYRVWSLEFGIGDKIDKKSKKK
jgi:hypothetical protein